MKVSTHVERIGRLRLSSSWKDNRSETCGRLHRLKAFSPQKQTLLNLHTIMETHRLRTSAAPTNFLVQEEPLAEPSTQTEMAYALCQCQMNLEFKIFHQQRAC